MRVKSEKLWPLKSVQVMVRFTLNLLGQYVLSDPYVLVHLLKVR